MESLFDRSGKRKYVTAGERNRFVTAALAEGGAIASFCVTLAITGARISEVLALTPERVDINESTIVFETLKRRKKGIFRAVPIPNELLGLLEVTHELSSCMTDYRLVRKRIWPWCRTTAWSYVKRTMKTAGIDGAVSKPKALRHAFAIDATQNRIPLNMVQRWMGHARIETTAIYAGAIGDEERALACRTWTQIAKLLNYQTR